MLASTAAIPQQSAARYTVEIVVFRTASQAGAVPGGAPAQEIADDGVEATPVPVRRFTAAVSRLRAYRGLPVFSPTLRGRSHLQAAVARPAGLTLRGVSAAQLGLARAGISGKVGLQRGQQALHLGVDLTIDDVGRAYHIREVRQLRKTDEPSTFDLPPSA